MVKLPTIMHNSFHPKPEGHDLIDDVVVAEIRSKWTRMDRGEVDRSGAR